MGWQRQGTFKNLGIWYHPVPQLQFKDMERRQPAADAGRRLPSHARPIDFAILLSLLSFSEI